MSRIANAPVRLPAGVDVEIDGQTIEIGGKRGKLSRKLNAAVRIERAGGELRVTARDESRGAVAQAGTARALISNMVEGVSDGFQRRLTLVGVGYRAQVQGASLNLTLGYSHPISFPVPDGVTIETPSQTEIVVTGTDKQQVGQVAAVIRSFRPPEPYKGKGVRYSDEEVQRKEAKKK